MACVLPWDWFDSSKKAIRSEDEERIYEPLLSFFGNFWVDLRRYSDLKAVSPLQSPPQTRAPIFTHRSLSDAKSRLLLQILALPSTFSSPSPWSHQLSTITDCQFLCPRFLKHIILAHHNGWKEWMQNELLFLPRWFYTCVCVCTGVCTCTLHKPQRSQGTNFVDPTSCNT